MHVCLCLNAVICHDVFRDQKTTLRGKDPPICHVRISCSLPYMPGYPGHMLSWILLSMHQFYIHQSLRILDNIHAFQCSIYMGLGDLNSYTNLGSMMSLLSNLPNPDPINILIFR